MTRVLGFLLLALCLAAVASVSAARIDSHDSLALQPGEPATNPFQLAAPAKDKGEAAPSSLLSVSNHAPATPVIAKPAMPAIAVVGAMPASTPAAAPKKVAADDEEGEAPEPPMGAVKDVDELSSMPNVPLVKPAPAAPKAVVAAAAGAMPKTTPPTPVSATAAKGAAFLKELKASGDRLGLDLTEEFLGKISSRLDAILDAQKDAPKPKDSAAAMALDAKYLIAKNMKRVVADGKKTLKKLGKGKLKEKDLDKLEAKAAVLKGKPVPPVIAAAIAKTEAKKNGVTAPATAAAAPAAAAAAAAGAAAAPAKKVPVGYEAHASNPRHKLRTKAELAAAKASKAAKAKAQVKGTVAPAAAKDPKATPRFAQVTTEADMAADAAVDMEADMEAESESELPPGVVGDGHAQFLMDTIEAIMAMQRGPQHGGKAVDAKGRLCPSCNPIEYNGDSPLSANDQKLLRAVHEDFSIPHHAKLVSQDTLDRAGIMLDDANAAKKALLDQYPTAESLIQFEAHN